MTNEKQKTLLVEDIRPLPIKTRSPLGVVDLVLDEDKKVTAYGVVYGLEHEISDENYFAKLFLDQYNQRIKIIDYRATDFHAMILKIRMIAEANGFDKIICMASRKDWQQFLQHGYVLEAVLKYYLKGEDAFVVSKFRSQERLTSKCLMEEILLLEEIIGQDNTSHDVKLLPQEVSIRLAKEQDIPELLNLYQSIFESYPSPLMHESYLEMVFQKETLFAVATENGKILAAASAELNIPMRAAELTDCATYKEARGRSLMSHILQFLEKELLKREFISAYTMARARSFGMNNVFYRLNYEFLGRLINNCDIYGDYEDMNIWVKELIKVN